MDTARNFLFSTLHGDGSIGDTLGRLFDADRSREHSFSLSSVLSSLQGPHLEELCQLLQHAIQPACENLLSPTPQFVEGDEQLIARTSHIMWLLVQQRKAKPPPPVSDLIQTLHSILMKIPMEHAQNTVSNLCEWLWHIGDERKKEVTSNTLLYLLFRTFGDESYFIRSDEDQEVSTKSLKDKFGGKLADLKRLYDMRKAFFCIDLVENNPGTKTVRQQLLRCTTSELYLSQREGRKFISFLLSVEDIRDKMFSAILNQLTVITNAKAPVFGNILVNSWITNRSDWLSSQLTTLAEHTILVYHEPLSSNLKLIMSSFHSSKHLHGIEVLLNTMYGPTLFGNFFVANPTIRRNAVTLLCEAFPIHDPSSTKEDVDKCIVKQCEIMLDLITDDSPMVRVVAIRGVCKLLSVMYGAVIPVLTCKKMIHVLITKMAIDSSSSATRLAVFTGLTHMLNNRLLDSTLSVELKTLRPSIYDRSEKVRLAFVHLLITIKEKRQNTIKHFDIVPKSVLLNAMAVESQTIATKIMSLIIHSYFPPDKADEEESRAPLVKCNACVSMVEKNFDSARFFYRQLHLFVGPSTVSDFAMSLFEYLLKYRECSLANSRVNKTTTTKKKTKKKSRARQPPSKSGSSTRSRQRQQQQEDGAESEDQNDADMEGMDENEDSNGQSVRDEEEAGEDNENFQPNDLTLEKLFVIIADMLESILPSLVKDKNKSLRTFINNILYGTALKQYLEEGNSVMTQWATWRIASCVSASHVQPLIVLWREQLDTIVEWSRSGKPQIEAYQDLLTAFVLCGIRWNVLPTLIAVVAGWADGASNGRRTAHIGSKVSKTSKADTSSARSNSRGRSKAKGKGSSKSKAKSKPKSRSSPNEVERSGVLDGREASVYALHAIGVILMDEQVRCELLKAMASHGNGGDVKSAVSSPPGRLISYIRKGVVGALDHCLEALTEGDDDNNSNRATDAAIRLFQRRELTLLLGTLAKALKVSVAYAMDREASREGDLADMREVLQWLCSPDLWRYLGRLPTTVTCGIVAVCIGPIADVAVFNKFSKEDLKMLTNICEAVAKRLDGRKEDIDTVGRSILEMTRLTVFLKQLSFTDGDADLGPGTVSGMNPKNEDLKEACQAVTKQILRIVRSTNKPKVPEEDEEEDADGDDDGDVDDKSDGERSGDENDNGDGSGEGRQTELSLSQATPQTLEDIQQFLVSHGLVKHSELPCSSDSEDEKDERLYPSRYEGSIS